MQSSRKPRRSPGGSDGQVKLRLRSPASTFLVAFSLICGAAVTSARSQETSEGAVLERGQRIAQLVCSACHVVPQDQEFPPILRRPAPSFGEIANRSAPPPRASRTCRD